MNEEPAAQEYVRNLLDNDTTLSGLLEGGVWTRSVPESVPFPVIKIDRQDASDLYVISLFRIWADLTYLIRAVIHWRGSGQPDWTDARAIGDRIDTVLHKHEGQTTEIQVHAFREESFTDETIEGGDLFLHVGGIYRVRAHAL